MFYFVIKAVINQTKKLMVIFNLKIYGGLLPEQETFWVPTGFENTEKPVTLCNPFCFNNFCSYIEIDNNNVPYFTEVNGRLLL